MKRQRKNTNILWNQHSPLLLSMVALAVMLLFISSKPQDFAGKAGDAHGSDIGSITLRLGQPQNVVGQNGQQTVTLELMNISEVDTVIRVSVGGRVETLTIPSRNFGGWYQFDDFMLNAESADPEGGSINVKAYLFDSETPLCFDEDNGINVIHQGFTILASRRTDEENPLYSTEFDRCDPDSPTNLMEYYCDGNELVSTRIDCSNSGRVCIDGRCSAPCVDTDGRDSHVIGEVYVVGADSTWESHTDECKPPSHDNPYSTIALENTCQGNQRAVEEISCNDGEACLRGRCLASAQLEAELTECQQYNQYDGYSLTSPYVQNRVSLVRHYGWDGLGGFSILDQQEDFCTDSQTVQEFFCQETWDQNSRQYLWWVADRITPCPSGYSCSEGRCRQDETRFSNNQGDVNSDGLVTEADLIQLREWLERDLEHIPEADIDGDGLVDPYDAFLISRFLETGTFDFRYAVRNLLVRTATSTGLPLSSLYTLDTGRDEWVSGRLEEGNVMWQMEYKQKGASRQQCRPPVLNIKTKFRDRDIGRADQMYKLFPGLTTYPGFYELRYRKMRFTPDCDVWGDFELGPLLREYFIYSIFRHFGIPAVDPVAFAQVTFVSSDTDFDQGESYPYLILQRIDEEKDQIPFASQFSFVRLIESSDTVWDVSGDGFSGVSIQYSDLSSEMSGQEELRFDPDTAIRYSLLSDFTSLGDIATLHNVDYGLQSSGIWKHIPFDFDISFYCDFSTREVLNRIEQLPSELQPFYKQAYYRIAREIFDNPDNLNYMLALVDSYPFSDNTVKMKNTIKLRFYYYALYFGSSQFASDLGQEYVPFENQEAYVREAVRIAERESFDSICMENSRHRILLDLPLVLESRYKQPEIVPGPLAVRLTPHIYGDTIRMAVGDRTPPIIFHEANNQEITGRRVAVFWRAGGDSEGNPLFSDAPRGSVTNAREDQSLVHQAENGRPIWFDAGPVIQFNQPGYYELRMAVKGLDGTWSAPAIVTYIIGE